MDLAPPWLTTHHWSCNQIHLRPKSNEVTDFAVIIRQVCYSPLLNWSVMSLYSQSDFQVCPESARVIKEQSSYVDSIRNKLAARSRWPLDFRATFKSERHCWYWSDWVFQSNYFDYLSFVVAVGKPNCSQCWSLYLLHVAAVRGFSWGPLGHAVFAVSLTSKVYFQQHFSFHLHCWMSIPHCQHSDAAPGNAR